MSLTGEALLTALSEFLGDDFDSTTTSGGTTSTLVDTALQEFGDRTNEEAYLRFTADSSTPGNLYKVRRITSFVTATATFAPVLPQIQATGKTYQLHRHDPRLKFRALDRARILAFPQVAQILQDETVTSDGESREITIPTTMRRGPTQIWAESPLSPTVSWNVLANPALTSLTSWTAASVTAAVYTRTAKDKIVPRLEGTCVQLTSGASGTYRQAVSLMTGLTAASAAGRRVSFGAMVYSRTATPTVSILDDSGTLATSTAHQGLGWEFLQVSANVTGTNATTLTVSINPLTNNTVYVEHAFFGAIDRISLEYPTPIIKDGVWRTDTNALAYIADPAPRGYQYRFIGRAPVSALGTTVATQGTNTMEVGENDQDLIVATAARILLTWEGMSAGQIETMFPEIGVTRERFGELQEDWKRRYPRQGFVDSSWMVHR